MVKIAQLSQQTAGQGTGDRHLPLQPGPATPASIDPIHYLTQHGYTLLTTYQPASRFWPFQWIEGAWLLTLSLLLLATTIWLSAAAPPETPLTAPAADRDTVFHQAVTADATASAPPAEEDDWRLARITDPFGHQWEIGRPLGASPPR